MGKDVRLLDLDPQGTVREAVEVRIEEGITPALKVETRSDNPLPTLRDYPGEVVIDVGTEDLDIMRTALRMADRIVVPVPPSQADVWATQRFISQILLAQGKKMPTILLFINRADTHPAIRESDETEAILRQLPNTTVLPCRIGQRMAFRRSFSEGQAVFELAPLSSKAAQEFKELALLLYPECAATERTA